MPPKGGKIGGRLAKVVTAETIAEFEHEQETKNNSP